MSLGHTAGIVSLLTYLSRGRELIFPKERLSIVLARVLGKDECLHGEEVGG